MRHGKRAVQLVGVGLCQVEKSEQQFENIFRAISFHFEADGIAATGAPQLLFNGAQKIFCFFLVDVEIAVASDPKRVHLL